MEKIQVQKQYLYGQQIKIRNAAAPQSIESN
jgi:hypothetical protein